MMHDDSINDHLVLKSIYHWNRETDDKTSTTMGGIFVQTKLRDFEIQDDYLHVCILYINAYHI